MRVLTIRMDRSLVDLIEQAQLRDQKRINREFGHGLKVTRSGMIRFLIQEGLKHMGVK
jgi:hypothetical protein